MLGGDGLKFTLRGARVNAGLTQKQVAKKLDISTSTLSHWEKGTYNISARALKEMSILYKVPLYDFLLPEKFDKTKQI